MASEDVGGLPVMKMEVILGVETVYVNTDAGVGPHPRSQEPKSNYQPVPRAIRLLRRPRPSGMC